MQHTGLCQESNPMVTYKYNATYVNNAAKSHPALQYTDDTAFPSLTDDRLQHSPDVISETYIHAGPIANTTKTEVLSSSSPDAPTFSTSGWQLTYTENFTYFGSNLSFSGDLRNEIQRRINVALSTFGCLRECVFGNINLTIHKECSL